MAHRTAQIYRHVLKHNSLDYVQFHACKFRQHSVIVFDRTNFSTYFNICEQSVSFNLHILQDFLDSFLSLCDFCQNWVHPVCCSFAMCSLEYCNTLSFGCSKMLLKTP